MKQLQTVKVSLILFLFFSIFSNVPTAHHYITWHLSALSTLFARLMLFFNVQWETFDKQVPQAVA